MGLVEPVQTVDGVAASLSPNPNDERLDELLRRTEREYVEAAHKRVNGDLGKLAQMIPVHPAGLCRYLDRLGLAHLKHRRRGGPPPHGD